MSRAKFVEDREVTEEPDYNAILDALRKVIEGR